MPSDFLMQYAVGCDGSIGRIISTDITGRVNVNTKPDPLNTWQYAAQSGGIGSTTTAVTIKAAAGPSTRNYLTDITVTCSGISIAAEIVIRDGAGGTIIYRDILGAGASRFSKAFDTPLKSSANTLLEVQLLSLIVLGSVYFNAAGFTDV